jgi:hypothetical protein
VPNLAQRCAKDQQRLALVFVFERVEKQALYGIHTQSFQNVIQMEILNGLDHKKY